MFITRHMTRNPVTVSPETTLPAVREILQKGKFRHLPVVNEKKQLVGMVTDRDLRSASPSSVLSQERLKACLASHARSVNSICFLGALIELIKRFLVGALHAV